METLQRPPAAEPVPQPRGLPVTNGGRSTLPSGRAVVGGLLIALAVFGTFVAYRGVTNANTQHYVVARQRIEAGAVIVPDDLAVVVGNLPTAVAKQTFADLANVTNQRAKGPIEAGDIIHPDALTLSKDSRDVWEIAVPVTPGGDLAGGLQVGETVEVVLTSKNPPNESTVIVPDAVVAATTRADSVLGGGGTLVTLDVHSEAEAVAVAGAGAKGTVGLARPPASAAGADAVITTTTLAPATTTLVPETTTTPPSVSPTTTAKPGTRRP
jgi:SAF domain